MLHYFQISQYLCEEVGGEGRKVRICGVVVRYWQTSLICYNFHSELWTFGAFILGSLNKKDPKSGKVTTAGLTLKSV